MINEEAKTIFIRLLKYGLNDHDCKLGQDVLGDYLWYYWAGGCQYYPDLNMITHGKISSYRKDIIYLTRINYHDKYKGLILYCFGKFYLIKNVDTFYFSKDRGVFKATYTVNGLMSSYSFSKNPIPKDKRHTIDIKEIEL